VLPVRAQPSGLPAPAPSALSAPFWQATADGELRLQRCEGCHAFRFPPKVLCPVCLGDGVAWVGVAGSATVVTHTVVHQPASAAFAGRVPYTIAVVRLDEGPRMLTNIVDCEPGAVHPGMRVRVGFEARQDGVTGSTVMLPVFRPER
jgi:uncharacterized OB-fold protein